MNRRARQRLGIAAVLGVFWASPAHPATFRVSHEPVDDTGNVEHRFFLKDFHFATLIEDPEGRLVFRPHPDRNDVNGWGTSLFANPFLAGADPGLGVVDSIEATSTGIEISMSGMVTRAGDSSYGGWEWQGVVSYDLGVQRVFGSGTLHITLDGTLAEAGADLNVERISTNFLHGVPLQTGGAGDTGDMSQAVVRYAADGDPRDFVWFPPDLPSHFPFDFSNYVEIEVVGEINTVDTATLGEGFQITIARKPTFKLTYSAPDQMIAGLVWDESEAQNFASDNVGINHLFVREQTTSTELSLDFAFESTVTTTITNLVGHTKSVGKWDGAGNGKLYKMEIRQNQNGNDRDYPFPPGLPLPPCPPTSSSLVVKWDGGELNEELSASLWKGLGNPPGMKGCKYLNLAGGDDRPTKLILIKRRVIKVVARSMGTVDPPPPNGAISTVVTADTEKYCAEAKEPHKKATSKVLKTKDQLAPSTCD